MQQQLAPTRGFLTEKEMPSTGYVPATKVPPLLLQKSLSGYNYYCCDCKRMVNQQNHHCKNCNKCHQKEKNCNGKWLNLHTGNRNLSYNSEVTSITASHIFSNNSSSLAGRPAGMALRVADAVDNHENTVKPLAFSPALSLGGGLTRDTIIKDTGASDMVFNDQKWFKELRVLDEPFPMESASGKIASITMGGTVSFDVRKKGWNSGYPYL